MATRTLLKGGAVLSMDASIGNSLDCDVLIEGTKILAVAAGIADSKAEVIDASEMIVMPGFIDSHRHMWQGLLRNAGSGSLLARDGYAEIAAKFRPQDIHASTLSSALGALDAGITSILDFGDFHPSEEHRAADFQAVSETGLRAMFAYPLGGQLKSANGHFAHPGNDSAAGGLHTLAVASAGPDTLTLEQLKQEWTQARELGLRICTQVGMGGKDRVETLVAVENAGLMSADVLYAHCNTLTDHELRLINESGGSVSISPAAEMTLGYGAPTIQRFLDLNIRPSLGVDSEGAARGDMFSQMRVAISMQHAMSFEKKLAHKLYPTQITTRDVLEFATIRGAYALGLEDRIGSLTPGKEADIVMLKQYHINVVPVNDPIGAVVWAMDTSNVDTVMVAGKILKQNGELLNVDLPRLRALTAESCQQVLAVAA